MQELKKMPNQESEHAEVIDKKKPRTDKKHLKTLPHGEDAQPKIDDSEATLTAASDAPDEDNP